MGCQPGMYLFSFRLVHRDGVGQCFSAEDVGLDQVNILGVAPDLTWYSISLAIREIPAFKKALSDTARSAE